MVDIPLYEARNLEHHQLNNDVREVLPPELAEQLHLTPLLTPYLEQCDKEDECVLINRAYEDTAAIKEADHRRDQLFLYMTRYIRTAQLLPIEAKKKAADRLAFVQKPYLGAMRISYMGESGTISSYVQRMKAEEYAADIETLGLTETLALLDEANEQFETLYAKRSGEIHKRVKTGTMRSIRPKVDEAFKQLVEGINALYLANELKEKDPATREALGEVIDKINSYIHQLKVTLIRAGVIRARKRDKQSGAEDSIS